MRPHLLKTLLTPSVQATAALLCAALLATPAIHAVAAGLPLLATAPAVKAPAWVGVYRWQMRMQPHEGKPFHLRLGFTALPSGDWSVGGSLVLDDAELGATGTARLRNGQLVVDLIVSGGVHDVPPDEGKRALFATGRAPTTISSAGFASLHLELDPKDYSGGAIGYMTNVVSSGNLVQGPYYIDSKLVLEDGR